MQLVCQHDPNNPDHLICESKGSSVWKIALLALLFGIMILSIVLAWRMKLPDRSAALYVPLSGQKFPSLSDGAENHSVTIDDLSKTPVSIETVIPTLETEALYYSKEGEQLGRGTWPLKAGETTKLKVFLKIKGSSASVATEAELPDIVITGRLAPNVQWTGFAPIGKGLTYEPATRIVRFVPGDNLVAVFEVAITPTLSQIQEKNLVILESVRLQVKGQNEIWLPNTALSAVQ
ncbi:hypothetical protein A3B21_04705 [Candidatus Uhrbacteria bacterium RIFCSPLOWO2_01_FULL_47_24]|uniref:Uncharacterized protein n=1 Tax=Candidatus Uhrbacteria bacterium RIFCSPLOWO2_01_FULL_47_24 TaxID=1802401 RepID=A0A1F7UTZ0_9BACT|nr:MAG: hypothetical protein A2753_01965 [Candidatus Uhrbacteria bacterium RIFCSPHIGHO2_01_FULL_47_11]OGL75925.1 MAG: hypothetical protein A3F52_02590 [Candidatus Uhrbacteria bacterium RIFCSPHIGHO2_12_FULL_47_11]OGL81719.1 MAG: hypothetical protein A3B21_04705 [Candidatus Uhrbacteria bacterium RIFCSPLOWO2_01_FULL_47_24]OGL85028.1 MAG: hypothetical protein A3J03_03615 [Candidatus Uhrbacteria bacterium RIFCSPLOWO2_02_FULL_46_25]OGL91739.1 MAG: hypothetical protein A3H11_01205 [Candidatus Uhrbacte